MADLAGKEYLGHTQVAGFSMSESPALIAFQIARSKAIEAYATVEQSLCSVFANTLKTSEDRAAIVFFKIVNTSSRNAILEGLLAKQHGATYDHYWYGVPNTPNNKGLFTLIRQLDDMRNRIVHWNIVQVMGSTDVTWVLHKPNFWELTADSPSISQTDLEEFADKAGFVSSSLNMFDLIAHRLSTLKPELSAELQCTWREVLEQPCTYPPAAGHPLLPKTGN